MSGNDKKSVDSSLTPAGSHDVLLQCTWRQNRCKRPHRKRFRVALRVHGAEPLPAQNPVQHKARASRPVGRQAKTTQIIVSAVENAIANSLRPVIQRVEQSFLKDPATPAAVPAPSPDHVPSLVPSPRNSNVTQMSLDDNLSPRTPNASPMKLLDSASPMKPEEGQSPTTVERHLTKTNTSPTISPESTPLNGRPGHNALQGQPLHFSGAMLDMDTVRDDMPMHVQRLNYEGQGSAPMRRPERSASEGHQPLHGTPLHEFISELQMPGADRWDFLSQDLTSQGSTIQQLNNGADRWEIVSTHSRTQSGEVDSNIFQRMTSYASSESDQISKSGSFELNNVKRRSLQSSDSSGGSVVKRKSSEKKTLDAMASGQTPMGKRWSGLSLGADGVPLPHRVSEELLNSPTASESDDEEFQHIQVAPKGSATPITARLSLTRKSISGPVAARASMLSALGLVGNHRSKTHSEYPCFMQKPDGPMRVIWDACAAAILLWQLLSIPFDIAFLSNEGQAWYDLAADIFWIIDIFVQCITGYEHHGVLHLEPRKVIHHYIRTWFVVDVIALLPTLGYWLISAVAAENNSETLRGMSLFRALKMTKLLKLLRVLKVMDFLVKIEGRMDSRMITTVLGIARLIVTPIIFAHYIACMLWSVGRANGTDSWVSQAFPFSENPLLDETPLRQYATSLYFAITITSTVGFGDISPIILSERIWVTVIMMFASAMVGVVVSGISSVFQKAGKLKQAKRDKLTQAARFLNNFNVPLSLQGRVKAYLEMALDNEDRMNNQASVLRSICSSGSLYSEVSLATVGQCLTRHSILSKLPRQILSSLCELCRTLFRPPGEILQVPGKSPSRSIYIKSGIVGLSSSVESHVDDPWLLEGTLQTLEERRSSVMKAVASGNANDTSITAGSFIDPNCLFGNFSNNSCLAVTSSFCELVCISIEDWKGFLKRQRGGSVRLENVLLAYASFEADDDANLQNALDAGLGVEPDCLFGGEGPLHEAAKRGASKCIKKLIEAKAEVNARDSNGRRPVAYALENKHESAIEVFVAHGSGKSTRNARSSMLDKDIRLHNKVQAPSVSMERNTETLEEFEARLSGSVDMSDFEGPTRHSGKRKSLMELHEEVKNGDSIVQMDRFGILKRYVQVVQIAVRAKNQSGDVCSLVMIDLETEDEKSLGEQTEKLPSRKMRCGENPFQAATKLLEEDLHLSAAWQENHLQFARQPVLYEEEVYSEEYPMLRCVCIIQEIRVRCVHPEQCEEIGLPVGNTFTKVSASTGQRHVFVWVDAQSIMSRTPSEQSIQSIVKSKRTGQSVSSGRRQSSGSVSSGRRQSFSELLQSGSEPQTPTSLS